MKIQKPSTPIVLFMSADIAGATAYKVQHQADEGDEGWLDAFETFFRLTPLRFVGRVAQSFMAESDIPDSSVWRVLGDEVIFISRPRSPREIEQVVVAFLRTIHDCNEVVMKPYGLSVRGCCWLAQMSGRNRAIHIPEMHASYLDYLGPDVDTGFRIASFADPGEVSLSYNLRTVLESRSADLALRFRSPGTEVLKGVVMHEPYPIVVSRACDALAECPEPTDHEAIALSDLIARIRSDHPNPDVLDSGAIKFD
jgi:hypothetical protein